MKLHICYSVVVDVVVVIVCGVGVVFFVVVCHIGVLLFVVVMVPCTSAVSNHLLDQ